MKKIVKQGTTTITYTYIDGFTYRKTATATNHSPADTLLYFAHDEGRVRRNYKNELVYDYFIEDHLGNIRMVLTEEVDQVGYVSTFEQPKDGIERRYLDRNGMLPKRKLTQLFRIMMLTLMLLINIIRG